MDDWSNASFGGTRRGQRGGTRRGQRGDTQGHRRRLQTARSAHSTPCAGGPPRLARYAGEAAVHG